ncbi:MAG: beta-lactamase hydrolase domain-containing protein [Oligoflexus sp.]
MTDITKIDNDFSNAGQPSESELEQLKKEGFRSVVNLRTSEETKLSPYDSPEQEGEKLQELGMSYLHIPVDTDNLQFAELDQFIRELEHLPNPVLGHCKSGARSAAFYLAYLAHKNNWDLSQTLLCAEEHGISLGERYQEFLSAYFARKHTSTSTSTNMH